MVLFLPCGFWGLAASTSPAEPSHCPYRSLILQLTVLTNMFLPWNTLLEHTDEVFDFSRLSENVSLFYPWGAGKWSITYFIARKTLMKNEPSVKLISKIYAFVGD